jgi:hypothetical protein
LHPTFGISLLLLSFPFCPPLMTHLYLWVWPGGGGGGACVQARGDQLAATKVSFHSHTPVCAMPHTHTSIPVCLSSLTSQPQSLACLCPCIHVGCCPPSPTAPLAPACQHGQGVFCVCTSYALYCLNPPRHPIPSLPTPLCPLSIPPILTSQSTFIFFVPSLAASSPRYPHPRPALCSLNHRRLISPPGSLSSRSGLPQGGEA